MARRAGKTAATRLQVTQEAMTKALDLFSPETSLGLWEFSTKLAGERDHRSLVSTGPLKDRLGVGTRRDALEKAIAGLTAHGSTGLYDTVYAAYLEAQRGWRPDHTNVVILITGGGDAGDGMSLAELTARLTLVNRPERPVSLIAIAYDQDAEVAALQEISRATGGRTYIARSTDDIEQVLISALFGQ
jgi:Ca-activated chloride channel family protein